MKQDLQITFREWAEDYYDSYDYTSLCKLSKTRENIKILLRITQQREVANDWYTLYQITTLTDEEIAQIKGTLNQKSIAKFKQQKNHPPADPPYDMTIACTRWGKIL